ncbi:hypothetical protein DPMN_003652 [Dreissena polymorpha]|uniref:Uncharacterized protein n=1 Tax=Dreissena polymorpha TaxID=45954 RepID=A0A9D4MQA5_DREPO|nr:hypothetical protein DPMN_003652 [Dreissena polymorpha]
MNQGSIGDDRNEPGTNGNNRGSTGKVLKGRTGNDRRGPGNNQDGTVTTWTIPQLHRGPYRPLQSYGNDPIAGVAPAESRYSYGTSVNRRSDGTPLAFTGAPPGHYRRRPGLNRGVAVALPV